MKKYNVAMVGATGLVGQTFLKVLKERNIEFDLINVMEIFKIFKEYEDVNFKILYEDEKNIGTIILKGDKWR